MFRQLPTGLTPPDWLVRNLQPQQAPIPWAAVARAALAMALPLAIGLAAGKPAYGALASMGALTGVIGDTADAYRIRILNIAVPQLFGAVGVTIGSLAYGQSWVAVGAVTGVALVSGMISTIGAVASVAGLLLLLNCAIGAGLPLPGAWWLAPALMSGGGLLVLALALLAWPLRSGVPERAAVAGTYRAVATLLEAAATGPGTTGPSTTGPSTTGPSTTGPGTTGPGATGPLSAGPGATGPGTTGSTTAGPGVTGPDATRSGATGPDTTGPLSAEPLFAGPGATGSTTTGPGTTGSTTARPGVTGPGTAKPDAARPGSLRPAAIAGEEPSPGERGRTHVVRAVEQQTGGKPSPATASGSRQATAVRPAADYVEARSAVTQSLNQAYDLVLARRARHHGRNPELVRLLAQLNAVTPVVEAAPAVHQAGRPLPPEVPTAVRHLAEAVETGYTGPIGLQLPTPTDETSRAVDHALRHASAVVTDRSAGQGALRNIDDRLGRPAALRVRAARAARNVVLSAASWRYGLRLALCIGLAQALVSLVPVPRSYWVALTITFVMKPDFGSVFSRALLRALGTVAGLVVAAAVLAAVPLGWWDVPVLLVLAPLIPALSPRGYGYQTAAVTPVILLLSDVLNHQGTALLVPRLVDSLMGCAIALVAGYLLWPESWHTRVGDRLADAVGDTAGYVEYAFGEGADPAARARMRRRLYRDLSAIRTEFQRALSEPPPNGRRAAAWLPLVVAVERIVDATTAAGVRIRHGAQPPPPAEVTHVTLQLRELSDGLRETDVLVEVRTDLTCPAGGVLEPLRQEVAAARAIASPR